MRSLLAIVFVVACVDEQQPPDVAAFTGQEDGFGFHCEQIYSPTNLVTDCYNRDGERGICAYRDICWRRCTGAESGCPSGYVAVSTIGVDDETGLGNCYCQPERCAFATGTIACGAVDVSH